MEERDRGGTRIVLASVAVAAVAAGAIALLGAWPPAGRQVETARTAQTAGPYVLAERDRRAIVRLHDEGKDVPWHWRRALVRRAAPALARWIRSTEHRLSAFPTRPVPASLYEHLALSFQAHELMRARFVVDPGVIEAARKAGYHFGRPSAVAFGRVIVFRDDAAAASETEWARQLALLRAYYHWGRSERFATKYLQGWKRIDRAASRLVARHGRAVAVVYGADPSAAAANIAGK